MRTVADPAVLESLLERLGRLRPETPRAWGTLTPHEMLCHLADTSEGVLGLRPKPSVRGRRRPLIRLIGLWLPFPWRGRRSGRWNDPRAEGSRPAEFEADLGRVIEGTRAIAASTGGLIDAHAIFGAMSVRDWQRYTYRHTHYHLRQFGL
jgi:hypothetical protein